ncbi:uncharacterized [Tachysurus ichikawai]
MPFSSRSLEHWSKKAEQSENAAKVTSRNQVAAKSWRQRTLDGGIWQKSRRTRRRTQSQPKRFLTSDSISVKFHFHCASKPHHGGRPC